jgi:hypothetical protein
MLDVTGCRKTQVSDCTSFTVHLFVHVPSTKLKRVNNSSLMVGMKILYMHKLIFTKYEYVQLKDVKTNCLEK